MFCVYTSKHCLLSFGKEQDIFHALTLSVFSKFYFNNE